MDHGDALMQAYNRAAARQASECEICSGKAVYTCPKCGAVVDHTHENDYTCDIHGFVSPIRDYDGARICGDGQCGSPRAL